MSDQIPLDSDAVARRVAARYQRIVGDLVEEVAQLTAYAAQLEKAAAATTPTAPKSDAWGDPDHRED